MGSLTPRADTVRHRTYRRLRRSGVCSRAVDLVQMGWPVQEPSLL